MDLSAAAASAALATVAAALVALLVAAAGAERRRDRRRILADGTAGEARVTEVVGAAAAGGPGVWFELAVPGRRRPTRARHGASLAAIAAAGIAVGDRVTVRYLAADPRAALIEALVRAERHHPEAPAGAAAAAPAVYYVWYARPNPYRYGGPGELECTAGGVRLRARQHRLLRAAAAAELDVPAGSVVDVEACGAALRLGIRAGGAAPRYLTLRTVDAGEAAALAARLPRTRSERYAPLLAQAAAFEARLRALAPTTPVTATLLAALVLAYLATVLQGGDPFGARADLLIRLGSNHAPLTTDGQWWRLLTSAFLHAGPVPLALSLAALGSLGPFAERLYGSARFLALFLGGALAAGLAGLWWHPRVDGAGAGGALYGVLGAVLAYCALRRGGVPRAVLARHRTGVLLLLAGALAGALGLRWIDAAAAVGGLAGGFVLGVALARPLEASRGTPAGDRRAALALAALALLGAALDYRHAPSASLAPGAAGAQFWGVPLGATRAQVRRAKGRPARIEGAAWLYHAGGPDEDGYVQVRFRAPGDAGTDPVVAVLYGGGTAAAPTELPYVMGESGEQLVGRFGVAVWTAVPDDDSEYEVFANGLAAYLWHRRVTYYGLLDTAAVP